MFVVGCCCILDEGAVRHGCWGSWGEATQMGYHNPWGPQELMNKKELVGDLFNNLRLARQRLVSRAAPPGHLPGHNGSPLDASVGAFPDEESINSTLAQLLMVMERLDARIGGAPCRLP